VEAQVRRGGESKTLTLALADGWRRADDVGWRVSTWQLRRTALGGLRLEAVPADDPVREGVREARRGGALLRVAHVGQYAPHDRAKRAGFRAGDVLLSFDGREDFARETDAIAWGLDPARRRRAVPAEVLRGGATVRISLPPE
jgi:hypothetical protein